MTRDHYSLVYVRDRLCLVASTAVQCSSSFFLVFGAPLCVCVFLVGSGGEILDELNLNWVRGAGKF